MKQKMKKMKNNENSSKEELIKYSFFPCIFNFFLK